MKILTFNTWGKNGPYLIRFELILQEINRIKPDIACLQEVFDPELAEKIKNKTNLVHDHAFFDVGLVILSRFPFDQTIADKYKTASPLENYPRGFIAARQAFQKKPFWVGNTHLSWKLEDNETRVKQISELLHTVQSLDAPVVLAGDFNAAPDSEPILKLKESGFVDLFEILHPNQNIFTWDNKLNPYLKQHFTIFPDRRIDFLVASRNFVNRYNIMTYNLCFHQPDSQENFPSDHFGVVAEFSG